MSKERVHHEGLLGKKLGMTHVFAADGSCVPVSVIQLGPCYVLDVKSQERDGYSAVKLGFDPKKPQRVNKPDNGLFSKAGKGAFYHVREIRCDVAKLGWGNLGQEIKAADVFKDGELVDISGTSIGRGFSGVVRRYKVGGQPSTRGTHEYRRHIGAIGCRKFPGHVFKNQRMPGQHGNAFVTMQNLEVVSVNPIENILLVKGGVPGSKGGLLIVRKATKESRVDKEAHKKAA
ncbi:MAG: 50S ribosomal protein L3 [Proteobacteria bacterium]|nr:MAG: 50S ribosomal protein L3 [Pseudomonadota bacterium]